MSKSQFDLMCPGIDKPRKVQLERNSGEHDRYNVEIDGVPLELSIEVMERFPAAVKGTMYSGNSVYPFAAAFLKPDADKLPIHVWLNGQTFWLEKMNESSRRSRGKHSSGTAFDHIKAPMPGTVLKVLVNEGDQLEANQPVVIMESMKMEMTLSAPSACVVQKVTAVTNQLVAMQEVLVELKNTEPKAAES